MIYIILPSFENRLKGNIRQYCYQQLNNAAPSHEVNKEKFTAAETANFTQHPK